ncbi:hypothetical protein [Sodalis sp.]|uniref:hypothetical protein n=1 Tax=Sodalis sp. (in: enterobacteria) TaxID=1898979 RepID=UPI003872D90E
MPPAPRAAAPAPMERTAPERLPQTDNDLRSGDAVTDLGNAAGLTPPAGSVSPAAGVRLPRPPAKRHGAKTALVMA